MFNAADCLGRLQRGELTPHLIKSGHPARPLAREPYCTQSQIVQYREPNGVAVALVHQYLRRDGTIGLSGLPDPKRLYLPHEIIGLKGP